MDDNEKKEVTEMIPSVKKETEKIINDILEDGIQASNIEFLYKVVDIHKDIANEEYWKEKIDMMYRGGNYGRGSYNEGGNYGRGNYNGDSYGEYREGSYGRGRRRDSRGRYMGHDMLDEMHEYYGNYMEGRDKYGADDETLKSFEYMLKSFKDYYKHLKKEASSQHEIQMLEETAREMLDM